MKLRPLSLVSLVTSLTLFTFGCSVQSHSVGVATAFGDSDYSSSQDYDVKIVQTAYPMTFPNADKGSIDVSFDITIRNLREQPVTIQRISLQSMSGSIYRLDTSSRVYKRPIAGGATETFKFWAPARVEGTTFDAKAPMVVRAVVDTIVGDTKQREVFNREVNGGVGIAARSGGRP